MTVTESKQQIALDTMHKLDYAAREMLIAYYLDGRPDSGEPIHYRNALKWLREVNTLLEQHGIALTEKEQKTNDAIIAKLDKEPA